MMHTQAEWWAFREEFSREIEPADPGRGKISDSDMPTDCWTVLVGNSDTQCVVRPKYLQRPILGCNNVIYRPMIRRILMPTNRAMVLLYLYRPTSDRKTGLWYSVYCSDSSLSLV